MHERLKAQRAARKNGLAKHKKTVLGMRTYVEEGVADTPEVTRPPTNHDGAAEKAAPQDNGCDSIEDGFAALRAQRARRKEKLRDLKRTTAGTKSAKERTSKRVMSKDQRQELRAAADSGEGE